MLAALIQRYHNATSVEERRRRKKLLLIQLELEQMAQRADMLSRAPRELERIHYPRPRVPFLKIGREIEKLPEKVKGDPICVWGEVDD
jgi:hypothetical protein